MAGLLSLDVPPTTACLVEVAVARNHQILALLLEAGGDANSKAANGVPLLNFAARDWPAGTELLLRHGADPLEKSLAGETAVMEARKFGDTAVVRLVMDAAARQLERAPGRSVDVLRARNSGVKPSPFGSFADRIHGRELRFEIAAFATDLDGLSASLARSRPAMTLERDCASRRVRGDVGAVWLARWNDSRWSWAFLALQTTRPPLLGDEVAQLSRGLACEAHHFVDLEVTHLHAGVPALKASKRSSVATRSRIDAYCKRHELWLPILQDDSDGFEVRLRMSKPGIDALSRVDVLVSR